MPDSLRGARLAESVVLLACPGLAFWLMDFKPISQNGFLDPYIYTGYVNNFTDLFERYGVTYYGVRFGTIVPGQIAAALFGPVGGYFVLRYLLALLVTVPFYVLVHQRYGRPAAAAVSSLLVTSPFLARTLLWDYPDATGVPFTFAAICLFSIEHQRRRLLDGLAGLCAGMALHSNAFALLPLSMYFGVYLVLWIVWKRGLRPIVLRLLPVTASVLLVTAIGAAYYWWRVGYADIFSITFTTVFWLTGGGMAEYRTTGAAWVLQQWCVLLPACLAILAAATWRRAVAFLDAVFWVSSVGVMLFYYVYQFLLDGTFLQLFYYFSYLLPTIFLLLAMIVGTLWTRVEGRSRWLCPVVLVLAATGPWLLYTYDSRELQLSTFEQFLALMITAGVVAVAATRISFARQAATLAATGVLGLLFAYGFAGPRFASSYAVIVDSRLRPTRTELDVYRVALDFMQAVPKWSQRPGVIRFWYSNEPPSNSMQSIQSTYLWGRSRVQQDGPGLPELGSNELKRIRAPEVKSLALLAEKPEQLGAARAALQMAGVPHATLDRRVLTAGTYDLYVELLDLQKDR